jgi:hypothetical protein
MKKKREKKTRSLTKLCSNKNYWDTRCIMLQLWNPLQEKPTDSEFSAHYINGISESGISLKKKKKPA